MPKKQVFTDDNKKHPQDTPLKAKVKRRKFRRVDFIALVVLAGLLFIGGLTLKDYINYKVLNFTNSQIKANEAGWTADWFTAFGLRTSKNHTDDNEYYNMIPEVKAADVHADNVGELTKAILSLVLNGKDPSAFASRNLCNELMALQVESADEHDGSFGGYGYISVESGVVLAITLADKKYGDGFDMADMDMDGLKDYIKNQRQTIGDFEGGYVDDYIYDVDESSWALIAQTLLDEMTEAEQTFEYLTDKQDENGFFPCYMAGFDPDTFLPTLPGEDLKNSNSQALALIAISIYSNALPGGVSIDSSILTKGEAALMTFMNANGSFFYTPDYGTDPDIFSCKQALLALNLLGADGDAAMSKLFSSTRYLILVKPDEQDISSTPPVSSQPSVSSKQISSNDDIPPTGALIDGWIIPVAIIAALALLAAVLLPIFLKKKK